ncbi:MAG: hypothetical protein AB1422_03735 [bacterium]
MGWVNWLMIDWVEDYNSLSSRIIQPQINTDETLKIRESCPFFVSVIRLKVEGKFRYSASCLLSFSASPFLICPLPSIFYPLLFIRVNLCQSVAEQLR